MTMTTVLLEVTQDDMKALKKVTQKRVLCLSHSTPERLAFSLPGNHLEGGYCVDSSRYPMGCSKCQVFCRPLSLYYINLHKARFIWNALLKVELSFSRSHPIVVMFEGQAEEVGPFKSVDSEYVKYIARIFENPEAWMLEQGYKIPWTEEFSSIFLEAYEQVNLTPSQIKEPATEHDFEVFQEVVEFYRSVTENDNVVLIDVHGHLLL